MQNLQVVEDRFSMVITDIFIQNQHLRVLRQTINEASVLHLFLELLVAA